MRIVVAPDKFKGSLPATEAAGLLRRAGQIMARDRLTDLVRQA